MINIRVRDNEPFERALKRFTKACEKSGLMADIKKHQHFEKPSEQRKRKENQTRRKIRKLMYEQQ
jgi:small subunit ribosomal protein S21